MLPFIFGGGIVTLRAFGASQGNDHTHGNTSSPQVGFTAKGMYTHKTLSQGRLPVNSPGPFRLKKCKWHRSGKCFQSPRFSIMHRIRSPLNGFGRTGPGRGAAIGPSAARGKPECPPFQGEGNFPSRLHAAGFARRFSPPDDGFRGLSEASSAGLPHFPALFRPSVFPFLIPEKGSGPIFPDRTEREGLCIPTEDALFRRHSPENPTFRQKDTPSGTGGLIFYNFFCKTRRKLRTRVE